MADIQEQVATLLQEALALLQGGKKARKTRAGGAKRGGNKGLIRMDLQRKMVLKEMIAEWEKLPKAKRDEKYIDTYTTKSGKEVSRELFKYPQPNYKTAISECKRRKDAGEELPEVPEEEVEAVWKAQQEKNAGAEATEEGETEEEAAASEAEEEEVEPEPVVAKKKAGRPKKETAAEVVEEAKAVATSATTAKKPVKKASKA